MSPRKTPLRRRGRRLGSQINYLKVRTDVAARAKERCELRTPVCEIRGTECHHLLPRSQGGLDDMGNCVWVCRKCHSFAHSEPTLAYEMGWLRHRSAS